VTEYLVLHKLGNMSGISVEPAGGTYEHPTECWALDTGKKVMYARRRIVGDLATFHLGGTFESRARYVMPYDELYAVLTERMGPCDRVKYLLVRERAAQTPYVGLRSRGEFASRSADLLLFTVGKALKFLTIVLLFPFLIMWFNKRTRR
jgi:hypothetical protein